jgi:hypothetical protein
MSRANSWSSEITAPRRGDRATSPHERTSHLLRNALAAQRTVPPWALLAIVLAGTFLGLGFYVLAVTGQPLGVLVRDANAIAQQPNYFGALEHVEILLMNGAGWIAAFSSLFCRGQTARFLLLGGLLSLLLAFDDLYMVHESSWRLGIQEQYVFASYGLLLVLLIATNIQHFLGTPFVLLGAALTLFAIAIVIDASHYTPFGLPQGTEDCIELIGICLWVCYFIKCSRDAMRGRQRGAFS